MCHRREVLNSEWFASTRQGQIVIDVWGRRYNFIRPHQGLYMCPPVPRTPSENRPKSRPARGGVGQPTPPDLAARRVSLAWNWGGVAVINGFDPSSDVIDLGDLGAGTIGMSAAGDVDVVLEIFGIDGVTATSLARANFTAADWNTAGIGRYRGP